MARNAQKKLDNMNLDTVAKTVRQEASNNKQDRVIETLTAETLGKKAIQALNSSETYGYSGVKLTLAALLLANESIVLSDGFVITDAMSFNDRSTKTQASAYYDTLLSLVFDFPNGKASISNPLGWEKRHYTAIKKVLPIACLLIKEGYVFIQSHQELNMIDDQHYIMLNHKGDLFIPAWLQSCGKQMTSLEPDTLQKCEVSFTDMSAYAVKQLGVVSNHPTKSATVVTPTNEDAVDDNQGDVSVPTATIDTEKFKKKREAAIAADYAMLNAPAISIKESSDKLLNSIKSLIPMVESISDFNIMSVSEQEALVTLHHHLSAIMATRPDFASN